MQEFREYLEALKNEKYNRFGKILQLRDDIKHFMASVGISGLNEYDNQLVNDATMKPTRHSIEKIERLYEQFMSQYEKMEFQIGDMRKRLAQLWKYLEISEKHSRKYSKYI
jgi:hypothetical protein